ncbi:phage terminase small subunit [Clostridium septicum]|uniref:phage terminase small subunit n=1 Tax=Clostridium septicum TaxID=1504 RepID=UPI000829EA1D|nr:phage terminase small subunit [Clostridium septicum]WLF70881.1 phage terminase small subunit [Clostridium septicum]
MARSPNENRKKAYELYKEYKSNISSVKIAEILSEKVSNINYWKRKDNWNSKLKGGSPKGKKNAIGNKGGAPKGNLNALKHGLYCDSSKHLDKGFLAKYMPATTKAIIKGAVDENISAVDILWCNIMFLYASIVRAQKIMYVKNHDDLTKELKKQSWGKTGSEEYELQFAWDKQERFIKAQASAMNTLNKMINDYEVLIHKNWDLATEEQKTRIEVLKNKISQNDYNSTTEGIQVVDDIDD